MCHGNVKTWVFLVDKWWREVWASTHKWAYQLRAGREKWCFISLTLQSIHSHKHITCHISVTAKLFGRKIFAWSQIYITNVHFFRDDLDFRHNWRQSAFDVGVLSEVSSYIVDILILILISSGISLKPTICDHGKIKCKLLFCFDFAWCCSFSHQHQKHHLFINFLQFFFQRVAKIFNNICINVRPKNITIASAFTSFLDEGSRIEKIHLETHLPN